MDLISVITPAYKATGTILETVRSVLNQTYQNWEQIIVSDDGFDYEKFLRDHQINSSRIRFLSTGKIGSGPSTARNLAIKNAKSDFIALLDSDDLFAPEKLEIIAPKLKKYSLITCAMEIRNFKNNPILTIGKLSEDKVLKPSEYKKINYSADNMLVFNRSKLSKFYNEDFHYLEDLQFVLSAFEDLDKIFHCAQTLHFYLKKTDSLSNNIVAPDEFIKIKNQIIKDLENNKYHFADEKTKDVILKFLNLSKKSEEEFMASRKTNPDIIFEEVLKNKISSL